MKKITALFLFICLALTLSFLAKAGDQSMEKKARTLTKLLNYIGKDYSRAVDEQKVINEFEYREMKEFTERSKSLFSDLKKADIGSKISSSDEQKIGNQFDSLRLSIENKASQKKIQHFTNAIKKHVLSLNAFELAPGDWPSLAEGKALYQQKCAQCHGKKGDGDGPSAAALEPKPTNFVEDSINGVSPFQAFNVIRLGIDGTSMRAFNELSDKEIWEIAFYLKTLPHKGEYDKNALQALVGKVKKDFSLKTLAKNSDKALIQQLEGDKAAKLKKVAALRFHNPNQDKKEKAPTQIALDFLDESLHLYKNENLEASKDKALQAYLQGVEPIEREIKASSPTMVDMLEKDMENVRAAIDAEKPVSQVKAKVEGAKKTVKEAKALMGEENFSFWSASVASGSILLREGLEAFLIIITILSVLRAAGAGYAARWVHGGWILAILIGIISWFFTDWLIAMGGTNRELLEGIFALIAVFILLYIGFWFHSKTEAQQWKAFVENKIGKVLNEKNLLGLTAISFVVVFREAFESVLFLTTLNLKVDPADKAGIWVGALIAAVIVFIIAVLILKYSKKIPIPKLFKYSAIVISILAVIMAGNGIHELQEAGYVSITQFPIDFRVGVLGIYPSYEILGTQVLTIALTIFLWFYSQKSPSKPKNKSSNASGEPQLEGEG